MPKRQAHYSVGQLVRHRLFGYRGVVYDVDADFQGSEQWYGEMALTRPPRNDPWYHVLVHGRDHSTYVAERNLGLDETAVPIDHPAIEGLFTDFRDGRYVSASAIN